MLLLSCSAELKSWSPLGTPKLVLLCLSLPFFRREAREGRAEKAAAALLLSRALRWLGGPFAAAEGSPSRLRHPLFGPHLCGIQPHYLGRLFPRAPCWARASPALANRVRSRSCSSSHCVLDFWGAASKRVASGAASCGVGFALLAGELGFSSLPPTPASPRPELFAAVSAPMVPGARVLSFCRATVNIYGSRLQPRSVQVLSEMRLPGGKT